MEREADFGYDIVEDKVGYSAGEKDFEDTPNVLRIFWGH